MKLRRNKANRYHPDIVHSSYGILAFLKRKGIKTDKEINSVINSFYVKYPPVKEMNDFQKIADLSDKQFNRFASFIDSLTKQH